MQKRSHSTTHPGAHRAARIVPIPLIAGAALFFLVIVYLVAASFLRREMPMFEATSVAPFPSGDTLVTDTVTIDASDVDRWRFFDFALGSPVEIPDTAGWDLAFRRFHVVSSAAVANLGPLQFDEVAAAPDSGYVETEFAADTINPAIDRWYRYNMISHQLEPGGSVYAVRTTDGRFAKLEFLSYYCVGMKPGCVTFRYAYQGGPNRRLN